MLTGAIHKNPLVVEEDDFGGMYGPYRNVRELTADEKARLGAAKEEAIKDGFVIGAKVRRKHGVPGLINDVGTVHSFANNLYEGFHLELPTPVVVEWTSQYSKWTMSYKTSDLELVK